MFLHYKCYESIKQKRALLWQSSFLANCTLGVTKYCIRITLWCLNISWRLSNKEENNRQQTYLLVASLLTPVCLQLETRSREVRAKYPLHDRHSKQWEILFISFDLLVFSITLGTLPRKGTNTLLIEWLKKTKSILTEFISATQILPKK